MKFSHELLQSQGIQANSIILVQKPYMERRAYATFMKQWPGDVTSMLVFVTSPDVAIENYPSATTGAIEDVLAVLVGDMARIRLYEEKGFQIRQDIPDHVQKAFDGLIKTGKYLSHLP